MTEFIIREDGFYRRDETLTYVGPCTEMVRNLAKVTPRIIHGLLAGSDVAAFSANGISAARRLDKLALHTFYRPIVDVSERSCLVPVWQQGRPIASEMKFDWIPPENMKLYLVLYWECGQNPVTTVEPLPYLVALSSEKRTYLLPIPNLYADCRICLGRNPGRFAPLGGIVPQLDKVMQILQTTSWNTDLLRNITRQTQAMFRFDANGIQLPIVGNWVNDRLCEQVNMAQYEFLAKL